MAYENISSRVFIARLENNFNIDYSDHHSRIAEWVAACIALLKVPIYLEPARKCTPVVNYRAKLPCNIKLIEAIEYNGARVEQLNIVNGISSCDLTKAAPYYYEVLGDSNISFSVEEVDAEDFIIFYRRLPVDFDAATKVYFPIIPDTEPLHDAIDYYLLMRILQRGHVHPIFNLKDNSPYTNPALAWDTKKKQARNSFSVIDPNVRKQLNILLTAFLVNPDAYFNQFYNNNLS